MESVILIHDREQEKEPRVESAIVEVTLKNGEKKQTYIEHVLGFPAHPMSREDVQAKAIALLNPVLGTIQSQSLAKLVWNLEKVDDVRSLIPLMIPSK